MKMSFISLFLLLLIFVPGAYPMGGFQKIPMKPFVKINIPDGEFLHYEGYTGGEKNDDTYMVIRKETAENGDTLYRIYKDNIAVSSGKTLNENYADWPSYTLIDAKTGSVLEWQDFFDTNSQIYKRNETAFYPYYFSYRFFPDKDYVDELIKSVRGKQTTESKYHVRVNHGFPVWDQISFGFYASRFMDAVSGGIAYMVFPMLLKEPAPVSFSYVLTENINTKAGSFRANKINIVIADPFVGRIMEPMMKTTALWIEDSDRRLVVKTELLGNDNVLEGISNIIEKPR